MLKIFKLPLPFIKNLNYTWWSEFREEKGLNNDWHYIIWNNRDIRIHNKTFFSKTYYGIGIWEIGVLHFDLSNTESYE